MHIHTWKTIFNQFASLCLPGHDLSLNSLQMNISGCLKNQSGIDTTDRTVFFLNNRTGFQNNTQPPLPKYVLLCSSLGCMCVLILEWPRCWCSTDWEALISLLSRFFPPQSNPSSFKFNIITKHCLTTLGKILQKYTKLCVFALSPKWHNPKLLPGGYMYWNQLVF